MKTYGLLGKSISYSLSPPMYNAAFRELGVEAEYKLFDLPESEIDEFFAKLREGEIAGCNVTIPYKEKVLDIVDGLSQASRTIGAVNCVVSEEAMLKGHNTDYQGFMKSLRGTGEGDLGFEPEGKSVFIFGAGGAAKAVAYGLFLLGVKKIALADLDIDKAEAFAGSFIEKEERDVIITVVKDVKQYGEFVSKSDLVVNATPFGMKDGDSQLFDYKDIDKSLSVFDLIYSKETSLVREAKRQGSRAITGQNMLLYQAGRTFELWTGQDAPTDVMRKALLEGMQE